MTHTRFPPGLGQLSCALALVVATTAANQALAAPLAFPGAEGFGAAVTGGRKGQVCHVTTLADSGTGSLRDCVSGSNRIVVFDISGVIAIASPLVTAGDNITIAGQSAPGNGVTVYGNGSSFSNRTNIIVRYMRFRQGINSGSGTKAVNITDGQNMIFDHVSVQWGRWDNFGITGTSSTVTLQNSIIGEGLNPQRFGSIVDSAHDITIAHNLWIDNESRNPKFKANGQYINNVVYDWGAGGGLIGGHSGADWYEDIINNYFIAGPSAVDGFLTFYASTDHVYNTGNLVDVNKDGQLNGRAVVSADFAGDTPPTFETAAHNQPSVPVTVVSAADAYARVLAQAGTCLNRDAVELRLIGQLSSLGTKGTVIDMAADESSVGGQPTMTQVKRPTGFDTDGDGIPDTWETAHGLNPNSASDGNGDYTGDGYTNIEKYLNELADNACPSGSPTAPPETGDAGTMGLADATLPVADATVTQGKDAGVVASPDAAPGPDASAARTDAAILGGDTHPDAGSISGDASVGRPDVASPTSDAAVVLADAAPYGIGDTAPAPSDARGLATTDAPAVPPANADAAATGSGSDAKSSTGSPAAAKGCSCSVGTDRPFDRLACLCIGLCVLLAARRRRTHSHRS